MAAKPQGAVTMGIAKRLSAAGWTVAFVCLPNSPHIGVIPIPTSHGVSKQRYPDVLAVQGDVIRLVEVEPILTAAVAQDIQLRFREMTTSLLDTRIYVGWRSHVERNHSMTLPSTPKVRCDLVLCRPIAQADTLVLGLLKEYGIAVYDEATFLP